MKTAEENKLTKIELEQIIRFDSNIPKGTDKGYFFMENQVEYIVQKAYEKGINKKEQYVKEKLKEIEKLLCDNEDIFKLRNTLSNAEWRRLIKTKIQK